MKLAAFSVRQKVLVHLIFIGGMLAGLLALSDMTIDVFPNVSFAQAKIQTTWTGASAADVEASITREIEEEIDGVQGIDRIVSYSQSDLSIIDVKFREDIATSDYERFYQDLRAALARVEGLPENAEEPVLREQTVNEIYPTIQVVLYDEQSTSSLTPEREEILRAVAEQLRDQLEGLRDVLRLSGEALRDRELVIEVDRAALESRRITMIEVYDAIRKNHRDAPAGPLIEGKTETSVRVVGEIEAAEELLELELRAPTIEGGGRLRLRDIATVHEDFERQRTITRYNGRPSLAMGVFKAEGSDSIALRDQVMEVLEDFRQQKLPEGVVLTSAIDTTKVIKNRIRVLKNSLLFGIVLVFFLLWVFVGARNATLAVLGVPFSFLLALVFIQPMGVSINALSLFSMVLVSGMIVDDAIIVIENIYRHAQSGKSLRDAAIDGTQEVTMPVLAATLTTLAAFLPMLLMEGVMGVFLSIIPKTVAACLVASLIECFLILPAHFVDWGPKNKKERGFDRWFERFRARYLKLLDRALLWPKTLVASALILFVGALGLVQQIEVELFPSDFQAFFINLELPPESSLNQTAEATAAVEAILNEELEGEAVEDFTSTIGVAWTTDNQFLVQANVCQILVSITDEIATRGDPDELIRKVRQRLTAWRKGPGRVHDLRPIIVDSFQDGPPIGKPVAIRVAGEDLVAAGQLATRISSALEAIPGVEGVSRNLVEGPEELQIRPDRARLGQLGLPFEDVALTARLANEGLIAGRFRPENDDEEIELRLRFREDDRREAEGIRETELRRADGRRIRLASLAHFDRGRSWLSRYHHDGHRCVLVTADVDGIEATSSSVNKKVAAQFADAASQYPGLQIHFGGEFEETQRSFQSLGRALVIALLLIYAILAAQFRSYLLPFVIVTAVPLAFVGVVLGLLVLGLPFTITTFIAIVGLAGIAVNDALVLMEFIQKEQGQGAARIDAIRAGCGTRLRAILLTTATTVIGLLPMSFELTGKSKIWSPFAATLSFGLVIASLMTLFFIPALYSLFPSRRTSDS